MKTITLKTLAIGVVAATMLVFTSCKKNHTCTCTTTSTSSQAGSTPNSTSDVNTLTKVSKTVAEEYCQPGTSTTTQPQTYQTDSMGTGVNYGHIYPYTITYTETDVKTCTLK
jgi:hypothetical protein